jgi:hypothetical protein
MSIHPPGPTPQPFAIGILDLLGYQEHLRQPQGLAALYERIRLSLLAVEHGRTLTGLRFDADGKLDTFNETVNFIVASDTIMLWAPMTKVDFLVAAVGRVFITSLEYGSALRGTITAGDCIMDVDRNILIGGPIVEAVTVERFQNWLGVAVIPDAEGALSSARGVVRYDVPLKDDSKRRDLRHALAWHWYEETSNAATIYLDRLKAVTGEPHLDKYDNAAAFIRATPRPGG